jgi:hypothetical protein
MLHSREKVMPKSRKPARTIFFIVMSLVLAGRTVKLAAFQASEPADRSINPAAISASP